MGFNENERNVLFQRMFTGKCGNKAFKKQKKFKDIMKFTIPFNKILSVNFTFKVWLQILLLKLLTQKLIGIDWNVSGEKYLKERYSQEDKDEEAKKPKQRLNFLTGLAFNAKQFNI